MTMDELRARLTEIRERLEEMHQQYVVEGAEMSDPTRDEWNRLNEERDRLTADLEEREVMEQRMEQLQAAGEGGRAGESGAHFQTRRQRPRGNDVFDLTTIRTSVGNPAEANAELLDRAKRAAEMARYAVPQDRGEEAVNDLL